MLTLEPHLPPVPVIETPRVVLRGHRPEDFDAFHGIWSDPEVVAMITGRPSAKSDNQTRLMRHIGHWSAFGWGYWAVEDKATGLFVGDVGFGQFRRDMNPSIDGIPEMGWVLSPPFQGKGYATEAGLAALEWMDKAMPGTKTCAIFHPDNQGSMRVAEKLGFSFWTMGTFKGEDTPVYVRAAAEERGR
ncbi:GNAT family N-acetyltransferase [Pelagibacterium limicola]|uniref:GNAT family N-acetyltransferase n=1 Tax=Pelagibacterium limicola TaxID=2791022 RepID=UPI0018AFAC68|nr:GNAT family N-acetyltransferase [Pelagibacterium limicola]